MTFKKFFYTTLLLSACFITVTVSFNIYMNEYGLFGSAKGKSIKIWDNERTSKYLLSYNYIPANFEGILIGPSVSDNLDTKKISGYKIYNASLNGGNISELKYIVENIIHNGNLKFIIVCLYPYITKDHGRKTSYINQKEYWSSLGSMQTLKFYGHKISALFGFSHDVYNDYGYNNIKLLAEKSTATKQPIIKIDNVAITKLTLNQVEFIDGIAYNELLELINLSRKRGVKIFGFYYPYFMANYDEKRFKTYKEKIDKIFDKNDLIWNLNDDEHLAFRCDLSNYYDGKHLSREGANYLVREINDKLDMFYRRQQTFAK